MKSGEGGEESRRERKDEVLSSKTLDGGELLSVLRLAWPVLHPESELELEVELELELELELEMELELELSSSAHPVSDSPSSARGQSGSQPSSQLLLSAGNILSTQAGPQDKRHSSED